MFRLFARPAAVVDRRSFSLPLEDGSAIDVTLQRHPRARRIKLSIDERGARLSLPARASERAALEFLHAQRAWLQAHRDALQGETPDALRVGESDRLPLRGATQPLSWRAGRLSRILRGEDGLLFETRGLQAGDALSPAAQRALRDFYEAEARTDIARWLPTYTEALPKPPARIVLKRMSSRWGSRSPAGVVALDLSLVLARASAFEYVLVHELCHLIHHDHSRAFWREVEARCPHWRDERDYLHAEGRRLKGAMRALCG